MSKYSVSSSLRVPYKAKDDRHGEAEKNVKKKKKMKSVIVIV